VQLRVSTEVEPAVFDEAALQGVGARVLRHVHTGWLTVQLDPARLPELRRLRGVLDTLAVTACEDRLGELPPDTQWRVLGEGDAHGLLACSLEAGASGGRTVVLRLTATARQMCFVRSHRTSGLDLAVWRTDPAARGGRRLLARHADGLRDRSKAGMHDWASGRSTEIAMWVAHLPPGGAVVEAGLGQGAIRVQGRLLPFAFTAPLTLG